VEAEKRSALKELRRNNFKAAQIDRLFERFADRLADVIRERGERYIEIEKGLIESKKALSQPLEQGHGKGHRYPGRHNGGNHPAFYTVLG
jgi:hypothetical protein